MTFTNNPCEFIPGVTTSCEVTANVATSVNPNTYSFEMTKEPGTVINTNFSSLNYDVTEPGFAFVSNWKEGVNTVSRCKVNPAGIFSDCMDTGGTNFSSPFGVILNPGENLVFVLNSLGNNITTCNVSEDGEFSNCNINPPVFGVPVNMSLNARGNRAFVAGNLDASIKKCDVDELGVIDACIDTGGNNYSFPDSVILNSAENIAFITNADPDSGNINHDTVTRCDVDIAGLFSNCSHTGTGFDIPSGIILNAAETKVFITNVGSDRVLKCDVERSTGNFTNCADTGGYGFDDPTGITLNDSETIAFVTNGGSTTVSRCLVNIDGDFSACASTQGSFNNPAGIALSNQIDYISLPIYPGLDPSTNSLPVTGIREVADNSGSVYITGILNPNSGTDESFGIIYEGPINMSDSNGWHQWSFPSSPGVTVTGTAFYGPNNGSGANDVHIAGNYTTAETGGYALGLLYKGDLDGTGDWITLTPSYSGEETLNTIAHSNMGSLVVGNYDTNLATGRAFIYNMDTGIFYNLEKPGAVSVTAYGIWHNGGDSYTIAGGYSNAGDAGNKGLDHAYIVDWDEATHTASNWTEYNYRNLSDGNYITHFEGITSDGSGGYNLVSDSALSTAPDNFIIASFVHVVREGGAGSAFGKAIWTDLEFPNSTEMSGNTVYLRNALGVYLSPGNPVTSYLAILPE